MARKCMIVALLAVLAGVVVAGAGAEELKWKTNLSQALKTAKAEDKLVLVDFYTDWCGWCKRLEAECYTDEDIIALVQKHFVPVKVDGDKHEDIVRKYAIRGYPTTLILESSGEEIKKIVGYREAEVFLAELKDALQLAELAAEIPALQKKVDEDGPGAAEAAARLGYIYRRMGSMATARRYLEKAKAAGYSSPGFQLDLLLVNAKGADRINGLKRWCAANARSDRCAEAYFWLGLAQANMKLWTDAVSSFDKAAAKAPTSLWGAKSAMYARIIRERYLRPQANDCPT